MVITVGASLGLGEGIDDGSVEGWAVGASDGCSVNRNGSYSFITITLDGSWVVLYSSGELLALISWVRKGSNRIANLDEVLCMIETRGEEQASIDFFNL